MHFDQAQAETLVKKLPDLRFDLHLDQQWQTDPDLQDYLRFYSLPSPNQLSWVQHALGALNTQDFRIATHYWLPENPKATLVIMHGYYDHTGLFGNAIRLGLEQGYAVIMFDLPGHGLSSGDKISIRSFDHYADVLNAILQKCSVHLPQPLFAWGQSTGAAILLNHLWRYESQSNSAISFSKRVLFAPLILPRDWLTKGRWVYALVHCFVKRIGRKKSENTHDKNFLYFVDHQDPLQTRYLSVAWVGAMKIWSEQCKSFAPLDKELLIVQGAGDRTVDWQYNLRELKRLLPHAKIDMIADAGHQLVNEIPQYRDIAFKKVIDYFQL